MTVLAQPEAGSSAPRVAWVNAEMDCPWSRKHGSAANRDGRVWLVALTRAVATGGRVVLSGPVQPPALQLQSCTPTRDVTGSEPAPGVS